MSYETDLLDLCRLNQMENNVKDSLHPDRDLTLDLIERKKREKAQRIIDNAPTVDAGVVAKRAAFADECQSLIDEEGIHASRARNIRTRAC